MVYFKIFFRGNGGTKYGSAQSVTELPAPDSMVVAEPAPGEGAERHYSRHDFDALFVMSHTGDTIDRIRGTEPDPGPPDPPNTPDKCSCL